MKYFYDRCFKYKICLNIIFEICHVLVSDLSIETWIIWVVCHATLDLTQAFCFLISILYHQSSKRGFCVYWQVQTELKPPFCTQEVECFLLLLSRNRVLAQSNTSSGTCLSFPHSHWPCWGCVLFSVMAKALTLDQGSSIATLGGGILVACYTLEWVPVCVLV